MLFVVLALMVSACAEPGSDDPSGLLPPAAPATAPPTTTAGVVDELAVARELWAAARLSTYHFSFQDDCGECNRLAPRQLVVWDGELIDDAKPAATVDEAFRLIEASVDGGRSVEAVYHPEAGYPTEIWVDRDARAVDGGTHWLIGDVEEGLPGDAITLSDYEAALTLWASNRPSGYSFRTSVICECEVEATIWTEVDGDRVTDFSVDYASETDTTVTPLTIDRLFEDLTDLIFTPGGYEEAGLSSSGSALYDSTYGYPVWIGIDIEVLDPSSVAAGLFGPRLIIVIDDFEAVSHSVDSELEQARSRWAAAGPTSYSYELTVHDVLEGTFGEPYLIEVEEGQAVSITLQGEAAELTGLGGLTIEDHFEEIADRLARGEAVDVLYNATLGFPVIVGFDEAGKPLLYAISAFRDSSP